MQYFHSRIYDSNTTRVFFLGDGVVRIHKSINGEKPNKLPILLREDRDWKPSEVVFGDDLEEVPIFTSPAPDRYTGQEAISDEFFEVRFDTDGGFGCFPHGGSVSFQEVPGRQLLETNGGLIQSFCLDDCLYYGFGEKTGPLEKTGTRMRFVGKDACGYDPEHTDPLYKSVPFFIKLHPNGLDCMGVFYHTGAECELDMGREVNGYYPPMGQFITREKQVDLFLIYGRTMAQVLQRFTALTGRPALLPKYALGYLGSTMYYSELPENCDQEILAFVDKCKRLGLPCSNFHLSSGYTTDELERRNVFHWNRKKFPDPAGFVAKMRSAGVTVTPNVKPAMLTTNPLFQEFAQAGAFIQNYKGEPYLQRFWGGEGAFVDFTNPAGRMLWKKYLKQNLLQYGIHSIWNDNNEFDIEGGVCFNDGDKRPATELRNVLALLMNQVGQEALEEAYPYLRPYQVSRSGCAGICRYAQVWTGDNRTGWDSLMWNIATMLGSGLSGMPLTGSDVGGFAGGAPDQELFLRWIACGVVMPRFSIHSANNDNTVTEPWMYKSQLDTVQSLFALRQRLMPLIYSLHHEAHQTGAPILRPMVWHFPQDKRCQKENVDFFLGDGLLCAPVVEPGVTQRKVWLPHRKAFYDFYTRQRYEGGQEITLEAPLHKLPLLQWGGSMVPTWEGDGLHLWCCPGEYCTFTYRDDDGFYAQPREDLRIECEFTLSYFGDSLECRHIAGRTQWQIDMQCVDKAPSRITADGKVLTRWMDEERLSMAGSGWYYDAERRLARIRPGVFDRLDISYEPIDLIKINGQEAP